MNNIKAPMKRRSGKRFLINLGLFIFSVILTLVLGEALLRMFRPFDVFGTAGEIEWMKGTANDMKWEIDTAFGFRPILGNDVYNEYGTRINSYDIKKRKDITRLLFMGDSVTFRGKIIEGLEKCYGTDKYEYWNAGVEAFNTVQEVKFYREFNSAVDPDHVILTFHLNDFETVPIVYTDKKTGNVIVFAPYLSMRKVNTFLFKNSYLYRFFLGIGMDLEKRAKGEVEIMMEVKENIAELKRSLDEKGIELTVLVHPELAPYYMWPPVMRTLREDILAILHDLDIRYFDLTNVLLEKEWTKAELRESPRDNWHPSDLVASRFAEYLYKNKLLGR